MMYSKRFMNRSLGMVVLVAAAAASGCGSFKKTPIVIFLDGASWFTAGGSVEHGLRAAGYEGDFNNYLWTSFLGWGSDHLVVARSKFKARSLATRIVALRDRYPDGQVHLMGLSAGTAIILNALEQLPDGVDVDHVVLFSSSVSAQRDLTPALHHVKGNLYATCSRGDLILRSLPINADGGDGPPAGRTGFRVPAHLTPEARSAYSRVVNLHWAPAYTGFGWDGGHVSATSWVFVKAVIAPRVFSTDSFPLDRPLLQKET